MGTYKVGRRFAACLRPHGLSSLQSSAREGALVYSSVAAYSCIACAAAFGGARNLARDDTCVYCMIEVPSSRHSNINVYTHVCSCSQSSRTMFKVFLLTDFERNSKEAGLFKNTF